MVTPKAIFDLDDTLCGVWLDGRIQPTAAAYDDCIRRFAYTMKLMGFDPEDAKAAQQEIDLDMARAVGFLDKTRFAESMKAAYHTMCAEYGKLPNLGHGDLVYNIGMSVFTDYPYAALDGALQVLDAVSKDYETIIVTKGEPEEQYKKLQDSGCGSFADAVYVVGRKDEADWQDVYAQIGLTDEIAPLCWAIGNSVKADVNPPLRRGLNAIHLKDKNGWVFEQAHVETPLPGRYVYTITDISEVLHCLPLSASITK